MKHAHLIIILFITVFTGSASSCNKEDEQIKTEKNDTMTPVKIKIQINSQSFNATLLDNDLAKAFQEMLPLTIHMTELNGNEKYYDFQNSLPTNSSKPGLINNGDLMLYGSKTLVLFYKTFSSSYSYTKLGEIDDVTGLTSALGSVNVSVTFEWEN